MNIFQLGPKLKGTVCDFLLNLGQALEDRIPFLGDLPLIGRLFRSSYEKSEKRNLLIFVTARLVDPNGLPIRKQE